MRSLLRAAGVAAILAAAAWIGPGPLAVEVRKIRTEHPDDATLRQEVLDRLVGRPGLELRDVEAEVTDGRLVLSGTVGSLHEASEAERLSTAVRGLVSIKNQIQVRPVEIPDSLLQLNALRALESSPRLRSFRLKVQVEDAALTITGEVPLARDRLEAEKLASRVEGITSLDNRITIPSAPVDPEIIQRRLTALLTNKMIFGGVDQLEIEVSAEGVVTLTGVAAAHVDRLQAERIAYGLPGVRSVRNRISVRAAGPE